jgi:NTP pyrophosphatase (non-canonical NTP hydrolase)
MKLSDYQIFTRSTAIYPKHRILEYLGLGIASEAGEIAGKIKKQIRDDVDLKDQIRAELGDVFWYACRLCDELGFDAEDVIEENKKKLEDRQKRNVLGGSGDNR